MDITTHNQSARLNPKDPTYKQWIFRYTFLELEKDLGHAGDITSDALFVKPQEVTARIMSKNKGILAGIQEVEYFLVDSDSAFKPRLGKLEVNFLKDDGAVVAENETVMTMTGDVRDILKVERTLLNLLGRMSGVATLTRSFVERAGKVLVTPTRKTLWGWLDKRACVVGGGGTHRLALDDAILVKDNHRAAFAGNLELLLLELLQRAADIKPRFIEIEVESAKEALVAAETYKEWQKKNEASKKIPFCIMFDNVPSGEIREAITMLRKNELDQLQRCPRK